MHMPASGTYPIVLHSYPQQEVLRLVDLTVPLASKQLSWMPIELKCRGNVGVRTGEQLWQKSLLRFTVALDSPA